MSTKQIFVWTAGRMWYAKLHEILIECGATATETDPCVYQMRRNGTLILIVILNDLLILSKEPRYIDDVKQHLFTKVDVKDLGVGDTSWY